MPRKPEDWTKDQLLLPRSQFICLDYFGPLFINWVDQSMLNTVDHLLYAQL